MTKLRNAVAALLLATVSLASAQDPTPSSREGIVDQRDYKDSRNGCGPASVLNLLKFSKADYLVVYHGLMGADDSVRMRFLVDRYFKSRKSVVYPGRFRWGVHGIQTADLVEGLNELLEDNKLSPLNAAYLDREEDESRGDHLARCHDWIAESIEGGTSPILSIRSFAVKRREENEEEPAWESVYNHLVVVVSVSGPPTETGFGLTVLDPWKGRETEIYLHVEGNGQKFRALKGVHETGRWLGGEPFLQVVAPGLPTVRPADLEWSDRFIVLANFLIGDF